jgi:hypothetical protein
MSNCLSDEQLFNENDKSQPSFVAALRQAGYVELLPS